MANLCPPQLTEQYKTLNPMQQVPAVEIDGITLSQSVGFSPLFISTYKYLQCIANVFIPFELFIFILYIYNHTFLCTFIR